MENKLAFVEAALEVFLTHKRYVDRALEHISDTQLKAPLDPHTNSIAVIMKHVAGNLLSRWTDFLASDGEKPWRNRDEEFIDTFDDRAQLLAYWEQGWNCLTTSLRGLTAEATEKTVSVRGEPHTVQLALARSLGHTCYHVGQIVQLARHYAGDNWTTLTIPRGGSRQFNQSHWGPLTNPPE